MIDDADIFPSEYASPPATSATGVRSESKLEDDIKGIGDYIEVQSSPYPKGKPYRVVIRGILKHGAGSS